MSSNSVTLSRRLEPRRSLRDRLRRRVGDQLPLLISIVIVASAWEMIGRTMDIIAFPPLTDIFSALWTFLTDGSILESLGISLITLGLGMLFSILGGIAIGALMGRFRTVEYALDLHPDLRHRLPDTGAHGHHLRDLPDHREHLRRHLERRPIDRRDGPLVRGG
jgi:hypothetical protein